MQSVLLLEHAEISAALLLNTGRHLRVTHRWTSSSRLRRSMGPWPVAMVVYGRSLTLRSAVSTERALGRLRQAQKEV